MAAKGWTTQVAAAAGVAAATGAAQLGLGYGLGVVVWPATPGADDSVWLGSLGWATWIAASSTVFGAMIAATLRGPRPSGPLRAGLAFFAGIGALLTVALVALPARLAEVRPESTAPGRTAATYALIGIALGVIIAYWAVKSGPVAANLIATSVYLWALAATAIVVELTAGRPASTYLTSWQFAKIAEDSRYGTIYWPSALITLGAAFLIGVLAAWPAARRGNHGVGTAASGAVGPVLVGAAFLLLAPQFTNAIGQLQSAYLIAPYAVLAGLAGSALVATIAQRRGVTAAVAPAPAEDEDDWSEAIGRRPAARPKRDRPAEPAPAAARGAQQPAETRGAQQPADARRAQQPAETRGAQQPADARRAQPDPRASSGVKQQPPIEAAAEVPRSAPRGGLFGRRKQETPDEEPTLDLTPPTSEKAPRGGLFGRRRQPTPEPSSTPQPQPTPEPQSKPAPQPKPAPQSTSKAQEKAAPTPRTPSAADEPTAEPGGITKPAATKATPAVTDPFKPTATARPRKGTAARKQATPPAQTARPAQTGRPTEPATSPETTKPEQPQPPRKSTVAAPPTSPPIAKINPAEDK